jgi:hypothetical protein
MGPIEILAVAFPGNEFKGEIVPALQDLVDRKIVRVIDLVLVYKDEDGNPISIELAAADDNVRKALAPLVEGGDRLLSDSDIDEIAEGLAPNSSAALLVAEHLWSIPFRQAILNANGELIFQIRVPPEYVEEALAAGTQA